MDNFVTHNDFDNALRKQTDEIVGVLHDFIQSVDMRFNTIETQLTDVKSEITHLHASYDRLINTIDGFIARIDRYEIEQTMRDGQFVRLLDWARKVSEKTGIPLDNL